MRPSPLIAFKGTIRCGSDNLFRDRITVEAVLEGEAKADAVIAIEKVMKLFSSAGSLGMFAGSAFDPTRSTIELRSVESAFHYTMAVEGVEIGAFRVLYNMLLRVQRLGIPLRELRVLCSSYGMVQRVHELDELAHCHTPSGPFSWVIEDVPKFHKNRVISVEFQAPLTSTQTEVVFNAVTVWDELVRSDGFAPDLESVGSEDNLTVGETYFQHPTILEHEIIWMTADDAAYEALINFFRRVHSTIAPVLSFTVM